MCYYISRRVGSMAAASVVVFVVVCVVFAYGLPQSWWQDVNNSPWRQKHPLAAHEPARNTTPALPLQVDLEIEGSGSSPNWIRYTRQSTPQPEEKCECTRKENCGDTFEVDFRSPNFQCQEDEICCNFLLGATYNDVDYDKPLTDDPIIDVPVTETLIKATQSKTTIKKIDDDAINPLDLENEENDEDEPESAGVCGIATPHLNFQVKGHGDEVDDQNSFFGEYPWTLVILYEKDGINNMHCAASLLKANVAVTAAHCVKGKNIDAFTLRGGEWDLSNTFEDRPHQDRRIKEVVIREDFNEETFQNDIAVLILTNPFTLGSNIRTLCLPSKDQFSKHCIATGWGSRTKEVNPVEQAKMKKVHLTFTERKQCQSMLRKTNLGPKFVLSSKFICGLGQTEDTCLADGGGPMFCKTKVNPRYVLVGITSWGKCLAPGVPGAYTNVPKYWRWIMDVIEDKSM